MLPRVLEPELMDDAAEARAYDEMDHSTVNRLFVDDLLALLQRTTEADSAAAKRPFTVVDLGTGTARIPIELVGRFTDPEGPACRWLARTGTDRLRVTAVDLAREMLLLAERNLRESGAACPTVSPLDPDAVRFGGWLAGDATAATAGVALLLADGKGTHLPAGVFDAVISNSIVHHIPEPITVFREFARLVRPGGWVFVRDLLRPESLVERDRLVSLYAAGETSAQKQLFAESLHAALTVDEVNRHCREVGWPADARPTSDRHWTVALRLPS